MKIQLDMTEINKIPFNGINVVSLFSGCGGSSLGYKLAGCRVLLANEFDKEAQEVYEINHPKTILLKDDIRNITGKQILSLINMKKGEIDILDGSPPCAAFSTMGKREKGWGKEKNYSGKKQVVDDLFFEFARILKELQPKSFVAENVKGLTTGEAKGLLGSRQKGLFKEKTIISTLEQCGYEIRFKVLNCKNYEVPQTRERLIIIGIRKDLNKIPTHPKKINKVMTTKNAIEDLIDNGTDYPNSPKKQMHIEKYFKPGNTLKMTSEITKKYKLTGVMVYYTRRDRWNRPFQTILQSGDRAFHPIVDRSLSINECKRLCTFPDDFILQHSPSQNWERIGRAVPPNLMKHVAKNLIKILKKGKQNEGIKIRTIKHIRKRKNGNNNKGHH